MVFPLILFILGTLAFLSTLLPSQKEKKEMRMTVILFASVTIIASSIFAVKFALDTFSDMPSSHVVSATLCLYVALLSLLLFIALPKDKKILPSILVALVLCGGIVFLGFAFHYGRVSLDNETITSSASAIRVLLTL